MDFAIIQLVNYLRISHLQKNFHTLKVAGHTFSTYDLLFFRFTRNKSYTSYLIRNLFSRRRYIVPVNEEADNAICTNATEAYGLLLANYGYALLAGYEILEHKDLVTFKWEESPHAPFGIYSKSAALKYKSSMEYAFIQIAATLV